MAGTDSTLARLLPSGEPLGDGDFRKVYDFLNLESDYLGLGEYESWYELLSPKVNYKVLAPAFLDATRPRRYGRENAYFDDDYASLGIRVKQLTTPGFTIAENPATISRHFVTNIRAAKNEQGIEAVSNVLVVRVRSTEPEPGMVSARRFDQLVETPEGLRIESRLAQLDQVSLQQPNLSFFI
jgi:3-phenylpropionate/cinnamic acid dioxygenase small subunit